MTEKPSPCETIALAVVILGGFALVYFAGQAALAHNERMVAIAHGCVISDG